MFIDLTKTNINSKITLSNDLKDGDSITLTKMDSTFTFKTNPTLQNDVELITKQPTNSYGLIKPFLNNDTKENEYINIGNLYGIFFSSKGVLASFYLKNNVGIDDLIIFSFDSKEYKFKIKDSNSEQNTSDEFIYVNRGNTKAESAQLLNYAINDVLANEGIVSICYEDTIVILNNDSELNYYKNAEACITFRNVASLSDSVSFTYNGVTYTYVFDNVDISTGTTKEESCQNLANAINGDETLPKIVTAISDDENLYLYSSIKGTSGNSITINVSSSTFDTNGFSGGLESEFIITDYSSSFGIQEITTCSILNNKLGLAFVNSAIRSLSNNLKSTFDESSLVSNIEYLVPNVNLYMRYYGEAFEVNGLSGALPSEVDLIATTTKLYEKLTDSSITCYQENNAILFDFSSSEIIEANSSIIVKNFSKGSMNEPMSWLEFSTYTETISKNNVNIEATFINGDLMSLNPLILDGYTNSSLSIKTTLKPFTYGNTYPFVITNSSNCNILISGMFNNECNINSNAGLVKIENCSSVECEIFNCEDTHLGKESSLVKMINCDMNSVLSIKNSTFTQADSAINGSLFYVSGNVLIKSFFNVFDGKERNTNNAFYLNTNCFLVSNYDCFSKITPTNNISNSSFNGSVGISTQEIDYDLDLVVDRSNSNLWSLNLTQNSRALLINGNDKSQPNDIFGNKRYLEKDFCKIQITINDDVVGVDKFVNSNYIEIDNVRKYFGSDLPNSYISKEDFATTIRNAFISSKYKIGINDNILSILGTNDIFKSNLGNDLISINYYFEGNGADAGSRQKHTIVDINYEVDLSSNDTNCLSLSDMKDVISSSYPCYGSITFNLKNSNSNTETIKLGCDSNDSACNGYCNFRFIGKRIGKNYVSTLKADLKFGSNKFFTFYFEGIIHNGTIDEITNSNKENTFIDIIFVNSIMIWGSSTNPITSLRILESTIVESSSSSLNVAKELIVSGCVVKYSLNATDNSIKNMFRFNYVITGYYPTLSNYKDETGTITDVDCLVNSSGTSLEDFALVNGSKAISLIDNVSNLYDPYTSITDIIGNYRCSENVKDSLDCGAYERNVVEGKALNFIVNLDSKNTGNGGVYAPCSLEEVYEKINQLSRIDVPIYIELNGYCFDVPKFDLDKEFTDNGSINFIGNVDTIIDCVSEDNEVFNINGENATISFSNLIIRKCLFKGNLKKLVFSSCALVNTTEETLITCDSDCYFYGCTLQSNDQAICSSNSYVIGCSAQAKSSVTLFSSVNISSGNVYYNGSIPSGVSFNSEIMGDAIDAEVLNYRLFELTESSAKGLVSISNFNDLYEDAESYNYNEDIRGFYRFDENQNTDSGCYDSLGTNDVTSFDEKPNGQFTILTDEGSSLITRMLLGKLRFKIVGFALGKGGYSKRNPIASVPITNDSLGIKAEYTISLSSNSLSNDDGIIIGNVEIRAITDFEVKDSIENTLKSLVECINKNNALFFAESLSTSSIKITALMIGEYNGVVSNIGNKFSVIQNVIGTGSNYGVNIFYPSYGYAQFEDIEHIPFALSLFTRIERKSFESALGEMIIYAKVVESELANEKDKLIPFALIRHGLITKDKDTLLVRRVIVQI